MGKHRAEDKPDGKSTSEKVQGSATRASTGDKHAADEKGAVYDARKAGSELPARGEGVQDL